MEKKKSRIKDPAMVMFFVMVILMGVIIVYLLASGNLVDYNKQIYEQSLTDLEWHDEQGRVVEDLSYLAKLGEANHAVILTLPDEIPENVSLCFRNKHTIPTVYVEDECIFYLNLPTSRFYTDSVGANWIMIPLKQAYAGKDLVIRYDLCYAEKGAGYDFVLIGSERAYLIHLILDKLLALVLPFIYLIVGVTLVIMDLLLDRLSEEKHKFFSLGWLAIGVGAYCIAETQLIPLFIPDQKIMHLIPMYAMAIIPIPAFAYAEALFHFKYRYTALISSSISFSFFIVLTILNFFKIWDFHYSMILFQIMLFVGIFMLSYALVRYIILQLRAKKKIALHIQYTIVGLVAIAATGAIDIIRYWLKMNQDPAKFIRIGFLIFLVCFTIASSEQIIEAFQMSTKAKLVSKLAYEDGLTGLKNRTSYNEALEEINQSHKDTGIVMMDVNNLKYVNDNFGHDAGDSMLIYASEIIRDAFHKDGMSCYRIGGDEFVVLIQTNQIQKDCEEGMEHLKKLFDEFNQTTNLEFKIVIASGYQIYEHKKTESLEEIIKTADSVMYMDKHKLKEEYKNLM